jgi:hypothetical protein
LQESASKDKTIEQLKSEMKTLKTGISDRILYAQNNMKDQVRRNFIDQVEDLEKQLQASNDRYSQETSRFRAYITKLEQELRHTRWITNLHKYLVAVEEDLQVLADRLSPLLSQQDRPKLYTKRNPREISSHPTMRWATRVYGRYYGVDTHALGDDMNNWWLDRNYFAHHSNVDELDRRSQVVENAERMHSWLAKLIDALDTDSSSDLAKLASDAFSDVGL